MNINITDHSPFEYLSNNFHLMFPYLKLELFAFKSKYESMQISSGSLIEKKTEGYVASPHIYFSKETTVKRLIEDFWNNAGIKALVSRKSGKVWIAPSFTENWTLEQQNKEGEAITKQLLNQ